MGKREIERIINDIKNRKSNVKFKELQNFIEELGYVLKNISGSHYVYGKKGCLPISIQKDKKNKGKAKKYQVSQIINIAKEEVLKKIKEE